MSEQANSCMKFLHSMQKKFKLLMEIGGDDEKPARKKMESKYLMSERERKTIINLAEMGVKIADIQKQTGRQNQAIIMTLAIAGIDIRPLYKREIRNNYSMELGRDCHNYLAKRNNLLKFTKDRGVTFATAAVSLGMYRSTLK